MHVHILNSPKANDLSLLQTKLHPDIRITHGTEDAGWKTCKILVTGRPGEEQIRENPNLSYVIVPFAGVPAETRTLLLEYPHIQVHNLHHNASMTAEMAIALLLATTKTLLPPDRALRKHDWTPRYRPTPSIRLQGKTILILGYGAIGQHIGEICRAMGMNVVGIRRSASEEAFVYTVDQLHELLPQANVLMICLPGTEDTKAIIGKQEINLLPEKSIIVNVGRGMVIDEAALYNALKSGKLHGAGIDVWYQYPTDEKSRAYTPPSLFPFHELENIVMSPHRAGSGGMQEIEEARMLALAKLLNIAVEGKPLPNKIDLEAGY